ncbi:MAG: DCC1-like thiol-disulfide oxidoreductase family protein [Pseudomonadota bacterium]
MHIGIAALSDPSVLQNRDVIVFDRVCVLCSGFFRFVQRFDRTQRFGFATAQSPVGQALYSDLDLPLDDFETNLVIVDGCIYQRMDAFAAAMRALGWPWRALDAVRLLPRAARDWMYHRIARNRYAIFGKYQTCLIPSPEVQARFLPGGFSI